MEPSATAYRASTLMFTGLGVGQMPAWLTTFAATLARLARAAAEVRLPPGRSSPTQLPREDAWRSYAVYSGALRIQDHKSLGRPS